MEAVQNLDDIAAIEKQIEDLKRKLVETKKSQPQEPIKDYTLTRASGESVSLSSLFGDKEDLIIVHNMGKGCPYCTLWADGFIGLTPHLEDRAGFVLVSPDRPEVLSSFAESRGWTFKTVSAAGTNFIEDLGFKKEEGYWPGISTLHRDEDGKISRIAKAYFGPGDDFCALWPMLDLLRDGVNNWEPRYSYA